MGHALHGSWTPWVMPSMGHALHGSWTPWVMPSMDHALHGSWTPWVMPSMGHGLMGHAVYDEGEHQLVAGVGRHAVAALVTAALVAPSPHTHLVE